MSGVYIHSTNALLPILESGKFLGTDKASARLGEAAATQKPQTLFIEWQEGNIEESVSRLRARRGATRGILVFIDPKGKIQKDAKYPSLPGSNVDLSELSLRAVIAAEEDLGDKLFARDIEPMMTRYKGPRFGFYPESFDDPAFAKSVDRILREALLHGCFS